MQLMCYAFKILKYKVYKILDWKKEVAVNQEKGVLGKYIKCSAADKRPTLARGANQCPM